MDTCMYHQRSRDVKGCTGFPFKLIQFSFALFALISEIKDKRSNRWSGVGFDKIEYNVVSNLTKIYSTSK